MAGKIGTLTVMTRIKIGLMAVCAVSQPVLISHAASCVSKIKKKI